MKYFTRFGCASLGVLGLLGAPRWARAQDAGAPAETPAPTPSTPAPASGTSGAADDSAPAAEPAATAPELPAQPASEPAPAETERQQPAASAQDSKGAKPAGSKSEAPARTWQIPVAAPSNTEDSEAVAGFSGKLGSHQDHWLVWLGIRNDYVRDATYDMFADDDALTVFSVGGGRTVWVSGDLSLAALGLWEIGARSAETRGNDMSLRVQRFELGPELRYHFHYRFYGFGRLGLGAQYTHATIDDELFNGELVSNDWAFAGDLSGGAAVELFGPPSGEQRKPRAWFVAEAGYALVTNTTLSFSPGSGAPERAASEELGELDLSAPLFRLAVLCTY
ncbi:MAG TPA: hypothetical protein VI197_24620 [Polyangiaceae bacterium]